MGINVYPQPGFAGRPDNAENIVVGGYFTDSGYTATGTYPAGLYALSGYRLNDIDRRVSVSFTNNNVTYVASPGNLNYVYLSVPETSIVFSVYGGQASSTVDYLNNTSYSDLSTAYAWNTPGTTNVSISSNTGMLYNSTDGGITWRPIFNRSNDGSYFGTQTGAIAYDPTKTTKYVAVRWGGSTNIVQWSNSTNGVTWANFTSLSGHPGIFAYKPKVLNGTYVFPHYYGVGTYYIAQSTNGTTWSYRVPNITNLQIVDLEYNPTNSTWIGVSNQTTNGLGGIFTSTDLTTWTTRLSTTMPGSFQTYSTLIKHGSLFVAASTNNTYVQTSTDGITWRLVYGAEAFRNFFSNWNGGNYSTLGYAHTYSYVNSNFVMGYSSTNLMYYPNSFNGLMPGSASGISHNLGTITTSFSYGAGTYIATSAGTSPGRVSYSNNLISWTQKQSSTIPASTFCSVYGANFVIGGASGAISTSSDAVDWTTRTSNITQNIYGLAYASALTNKYVGVGPSGNITYSTNSVTWTAATTGTANLQDVIFAGGKYVAIGYSGTTGVSYISTNGNTWTTNTLTGIPALGKITFFNNLYIAVQTRAVFSTVGGSDFTRIIYTSTDAISWTTRSLTSSYFSSNHGFISVEAGGNNVIAVTSEGLAVTSFDGTTWTAQNMFIWTSSQRSLASNGSRLLGITVSQQTGTSDPRWIYTDNNGDSWTVTNNEPASIYTVTHNGVGSEFIGTIDNNNLWYSTTGQTWTAIANFNSNSYSQALTSPFIVKDGGQKIISVGGYAGSGATATTGYIYVSSNSGQTWQRVDAGLAGFGSNTTSIFTLGAGQTQVIGLPYNYSSVNTAANNTFRYSTDGITWSSSAAFAFSTGGTTYQVFGGIAYSPSNKIFVYPMFSTVSSQQFITFARIVEDTLAHSISATFSTTAASSGFIAYGDNKFLAGGLHTAATTVSVYVSDAFGVSWTTRSMSSPVSTTPSGAAYGNGTWLVVGNNQYFTSTDAITWTSRGAGVQSSVQNGVKFIDGAFYVAQSNNTFVVSTDASTWTTVTIPMPEVPSGQKVNTFVKGSDSVIVQAAPGSSLYTNGQQAQAAVAYLYSVDASTYA